MGREKTAGKKRRGGERVWGEGRGKQGGKEGQEKGRRVRHGWRMAERGKRAATEMGEAGYEGGGLNAGEKGRGHAPGGAKEAGGSRKRDISDRSGEIGVGGQMEKRGKRDNEGELGYQNMGRRRWEVWVRWPKGLRRGGRRDNRGGKGAEAHEGRTGTREEPTSREIWKMGGEAGRGTPGIRNSREGGVQASG
ncbi:hypothetical protein Tco_0793729 [Tanacetum coccineum]